MWTAATTAHFLSVTPLEEQTHPLATCLDLYLTSSVRQLPRKPSLVPYQAFLSHREASSSMSKLFSGESNYYFIYFAFPCSSKPLWGLTLQYVLRLPIITPNERSPLRMFPTTCQLEGEALRSPGVQTGVSLQPAAAERASWRESKPGPSQQEVLQMRTEGLLYSGTTGLRRAT